jgi:hypothetical protein
MHVVFVEFITILLFVHHMLTEFRSSFKVASISNICLPLMLKVVSSAYISISDVKFSSGRSFINILKSRGLQNGPLCYSIFYRFEVRDVVSNTYILCSE